MNQHHNNENFQVENPEVVDEGETALDITSIGTAQSVGNVDEGKSFTENSSPDTSTSIQSTANETVRSKSSKRSSSENSQISKKNE